MKILALDIGKTMGAACSLWPTPLHHTYEGDRRERAGRLMHWLNGTLRSWKPSGLEVVVYEDTFARGIAATKALYGLVGVIEACCYSAGFTAMGVPTATVKQFATGKGNATKDEMIAAAQIMGYDGDNEHEADAFCLLKYAEANVIEDHDNDQDASGDSGKPTASPRRGRKGTVNDPSPQPDGGSGEAGNLWPADRGHTSDLADEGAGPGPDDAPGE